MLFRFKAPAIKADSPVEMLVRIIMLIAVFGGVVAAFWYQTGQTMQQLQARGAVWDEAQLLTEDQREALRDVNSRFREDFGIKLKIHIRSGVVELPDNLDGRTLFIGINPKTQQVMLEFPPLMRKAMGDQYMYDLQNNHFTPYWKDDNWRRGLIDLLQRVWNDLAR